MKRSDIAYVVGSVFAGLTAFFYFCAMWFSIRLPRYYPLERSWKWVKEQGVPSQGWYGMQAFAYLAAGVVALIVYFVLKHTANKELDLKPAQVKMLGIATTVMIVVYMGFMLYYEFDKWGIF